MKENIRNPEARDSLTDNPAGMQELEDAVLNSITGGCNPDCGGGTGPTTRDFSCVPPGEQCP